MRFGSLDISIAPDASFRLDGGAMFGVVPKVLWERQFPADEKNRISLATNCLLVRGPGFTAVVETGIGQKWNEKTRGIYGIEREPTLSRSLASFGVQVADVDALVLSHLHFDHAGGATREEEGRLSRTFPNATLYVQEAELSHARAPNEHDRASYLRGDWEPYADAGMIETVTGQAEIRPGLTVLPVRGHNAGMQAIRLDSEGQTAFYFADALPTTAHIPIPWIMSYDLFPVELMENKKRLVDQAVRDRWLCVFEHDPRVPWGRIVEGEDGKRRVEPVPTS